MRIRVLSSPPLPHVKAWFIVPDGAQNIASSSLVHAEPSLKNIFGLKNALRNGIPALRPSSLSAADLILMIDGFELLDESSTAVINDGDLVVVHINPNTPRRPLANHPDQSLPPTPSHPNQISSFKSGSASTEIVSSLLRTEKKRKRDRSPSTESYSSSSAESDTSTTSSSLSSSSPSSSSSSSSSPSIQTSKPTQVRSESRNVVTTRTPTRYDKTAASAFTYIVDSAKGRPPLVPPGQGKAKTRMRNQRRRLSRASRKPSNPPDTTTSSFQANQTPDEPEPTLVTQSTDAPTRPLPSYSLRNKNKRRGFKEAMASVTPKRIDFKNANAAPSVSPSANAQPPQSFSEAPAIGMTLLDDTSLRSVPQSFAIGDNSVKHTAKPRVTADLVPPSRRKDLPANIIVTVVDVESDLWDNTNAAEPSQNIVTETALQSDSNIDWSVLDSRWNDLKPLDTNVLAIGHVVGWQELGLDHITFSPKLLVILGRVTGISVPPDASSRATIERLIPPDNGGDPEASVGLEDPPDVNMEMTFEEMKSWRFYSRN